MAKKAKARAKVKAKTKSRAKVKAKAKDKTKAEAEPKLRCPACGHQQTKESDKNWVAKVKTPYIRYSGLPNDTTIRVSHKDGTGERVVELLACPCGNLFIDPGSLD